MTTLDNPGDKPSVSNLGRYIDTCVKVGGHWLIAEKVIDLWNRTLVNSIKDARYQMRVADENLASGHRRNLDA